jgi:hypothetical protein
MTGTERHPGSGTLKLEIDLYPSRAGRKGELSYPGAIPDRLHGCADFRRRPYDQCCGEQCRQTNTMSEWHVIDSFPQYSSNSN